MIQPFLPKDRSVQNIIRAKHSDCSNISDTFEQIIHSTLFSNFTDNRNVRMDEQNYSLEKTRHHRKKRVAGAKGMISKITFS